MNNRTRISLVLASYLALSLMIGCSKGGSSGGGGVSNQPVTYNGKTSQATIDINNANKIFSVVWGGGPSNASSSSAASPSLETKTYAEMITSKSTNGSVVMHNDPQKAAQYSAQVVYQSFNGSVSGTVTYSGTINDDGTGVVAITYVDYNDGEEITYDGQATLTVNAYDDMNSLITNEDLAMSRLTLRSPTGAITLSGIIHTENDMAGKTTRDVYNMDGRDESSNETFRMENYSVTQVYDDWFIPKVCTEMTTGRVYVETEGYVDVSQSGPFIYNYYQQFNEDVPDSGGSWIFDGARGTRERIIPLSISQFQIDVDADGDGSYENSNVYLWTTFTGIVYRFKAAFGTTGYDEGYSVKATSDGGYIAAGYTNSSPTTRIDFYLVKTNAAGKAEWAKSFGGANDDFARSVVQTSDGGYLVAGYTYPPNSTGAEDIYLVKTDASGNLIWQKTLGSQYSDWAYSLQETKDNGFIIAGAYAQSWPDMYLVKITSDGTVAWEQKFGGNYDQAAYSVISTSDGGYALAGYAMDNATGRDNLYVVKTGENGNLVWEKSFGKPFDDRAYSIKETSDGGYAVAGISGNQGYLGKMNSTGTILWEKTFAAISEARSVIQTADGGFVIAGMNSTDAHLIRTDDEGQQLWDRTINGVYVKELQQGLDGGFVIVGYTDAWSPATNSIQKDVCLAKTDSNGNITGPYYLRPVVLRSITITPPNPTIVQGLTRQLTATGNYSDGTMRNLNNKVTWRSSDTSTVTVGNSGLATAIAVGSAGVSATLGDITGSTSVTVNPIVPVSITLTPSGLGIPRGRTQQFTALLNYSDNTSRDVTATATWASANPGIAAFSTNAGEQGLLSAQANGRTMITATDPGTNLKGSAPVAVGSLTGGTLQGNPLSLSSIISTIAGTTGVWGHKDGVGTAATFGNVHGITTDGTTLYVTDSGNQTIRKIVLATGDVTTLAGSFGVSGFTNGIGTAATFAGPTGITTDGTNLYVADTSNSAIRKIVIATGEVTTLAGGGGVFIFYSPNDLTTPDGIDLYVADTGNHVIRKVVIATGEVTTFAGTVGSSGSSDGTGTTARFSSPRGITTDGTNLYVADWNNSAIRKIVISSGEVSTLAGLPGSWGSNDGVGASARFNLPSWVTCDGTDLYVVDQGNNSLRKIDIATGTVSTLTPKTISGGGPMFGNLEGITTEGNYLYLADSLNYTIQKIE